MNAEEVWIVVHSAIDISLEDFPAIVQGYKFMVCLDESFLATHFVSKLFWMLEKLGLPKSDFQGSLIVV